MTNRTAFHRCVLYALAELRRTFLADNAFHEAYGKALEGSPLQLAQRFLEEQDPVFGTYREAEYMLHEGMFSCLLDIDGSTFTRAYFRISAKSASKELDEVAGADAAAFREIGRKFHEALK